MLWKLLAACLVVHAGVQNDNDDFLQEKQVLPCSGF